MKLGDLCHRCSVGELKPHCPESNTNCRWRRCAVRTCAAVFDEARRRGFVMEKDIAVPLTIPPPP